MLPLGSEQRTPAAERPQVRPPATGVSGQTFGEAALELEGLTRDEDVLEELARAPAGAAVHVAPVALLELEARPLEDGRVQVAAVVDDDDHGRPRPERRPRVPEHGDD